MSVFNRNNKYGKHLIEAIVPGWGSGIVEGTNTESGIVKGVGGRRIDYLADQLQAPTTASIDQIRGKYQFGQDVPLLQLTQEAQNLGYRYKAVPGDTGPALGSTFTVVSIVKPIGNGDAGASDPRFYSKDEGATEGAHDLMIGLLVGTYARPRTRIRIGTVTQTTALDDNPANNIESDGWHLIASVVKKNDTSTDVEVHGVYPDGRYVTDSNNRAGQYNPRTSTSESIYASSGVDQNSFSGSIMVVYFFRGVRLSEEDFRSLYQNPWQVFAPKRYFAHTQKYFPPVIEAEAPAGNTLTITLVDAAGTTLPNLTGLSWAWFDESTVSTLTAPTAQGTGETTDVSGVLEVDITGTTLGATDTGILTLRDSTGHIYALYRVTLT